MNDIQQRIFGKATPEPNSGCWIWAGTCNWKGYGTISIGGVQRKAHRASYEAFVGAIPDGMLVCHKCDNPPCVNPDHLFVGTAKDNAQDRDAKGRRGHTGSQRTAPDVERRVMDARASGLGYKKISKLFGVTIATARRIVIRNAA